MVKVRMVAATFAVALGGLTATGAALAGGPPADRPAKNKAAICERLDHMIEQKQNAGKRLTKVALKIEARMNSGKLSERQMARAAKHLARVEALIEKLDKRADRLQAAFDKHCTTTP
jgi:hypothetical protein